MKHDIRWRVCIKVNNNDDIIKLIKLILLLLVLLLIIIGKVVINYTKIIFNMYVLCI